MASNEWLVRKLHEQDKKIEALSRGGTGVGHTSIAPGENLTVISDNGEVVLGAGGVEHVDGPTPATPSAPTLKLGFGTIETTWDGSFAEGEDEDGVPLTAPVDFDVVEVHCSTDPEEEEWGEDTMRGQIKTREGGTITVGGFDVDDEVFVCLIALAKTGKRSAPSATASLVIEGLDFSALFNELDAANATIKNAGEVLVSEQGTLDEKLTEVDGTLDNLGQDLEAVEAAQEALSGDLTDVMTSVDGKNTITWNPSAPSKVSNPGKAVGDLWYRTSGNNIIGFWKWDGTDWVTQLLDRTTIPQIDIGAGTFGSLSGVRLEAGTVSASSIAVGDFSNLATIDPVRNVNVTRPENWSTETVGDYITPKATSQNYLMFKDRTNTVPFKAGDQLRVELKGVSDVNGSVLLRLWGYPALADGATSGLVGVSGDSFSFTTTEQSFSGKVTIPESFGASTTLRSWIIGLGPQGGLDLHGVRVRDVRVYRMTDTTLIQNGAVSTGKLAADVLEVKNLKATSGQLNEAVINKLFSDVVVAKTAVAEQFIGENAILTGAVTAPKITASEELWAKIGQFVKIRAEHIEADAIDGMVITGATIRSAATGARTLMSASGFEAYNTANERTFFADASTGEVSITGKLFTGKSGFSRVSLDPTLWSSLPVYNEDGTVAGYANGAGVRVGIDASNSMDMYHAGLSGTVRSGVIRGPGGVAKVILNGSAVQIQGENSLSTMSAGFGGRFRARSTSKTDSSDYSVIDSSPLFVSIDTYWGSGNSSGISTGQGSARINSIEQGKYSSVKAEAGNVELKTYYGGFDTSWLRLTGSDTAGSTYIDVSAEHINPLRINYAGTGDSWIIPFRKSGTSWGYVGSTGAMGVDEFGIQSAAGKNLKLQTTSSSDSVLLNGGGADITLLDDGGPKVRSNAIAATVGSPGSAASGAVYIRTASGNMFVSSSSKRYKTNISDAKELPRLLDVSVRTWQDKADVELAERLKKFREETGEGPVPQSLSDAEVDAPRSFGAVAEEVDELGLSELVRYDAYGRPDGLHYEMFGVALIPEIRKLRDRITELERLTHE